MTGWLVKTYSAIACVEVWTGVGYNSMYRAIADIALGCFCYVLYEKLSEYDFTRVKRILISIFQMGLIWFVLYYMNDPFKNKKFEGIILLLLAIIVVIAFSGKTIYSDLLNNKYILYLGKFSLSVYLIHFSCYLILDKMKL